MKKNTPLEKARIYLMEVQKGTSKVKARELAGYSKSTRERDILNSKAYKKALEELDVGKGRKNGETTKAQKYLEKRVEGKTKKDAALEAGYSKSTAENAKEKIESTQEFQDARGNLLESMDKAGITNDVIAQRLYLMLMQREQRMYNGKMIVEKEVDVSAANAALDKILRILGSFAPKKVEGRVVHDLSNIKALPERELDNVLSQMIKGS